ncbi:MAG: hypothetical protein GXO79_02945 [Chlorobi bacterium]|nr:hypothetical protein [Chlorobiota bacterium]
MEKFLKLVAENIYAKAKENISEYAVIFPNIRAGVFFQKYLSEVIEKPVWMPAIFTIQEFVQKVAGIRIGENINLIFDLFSTYKKTFPNAENLDDFYYWGEMLINDFNDVDKYLANPEDLFRNLAGFKNLDDYNSFLTEDQVAAIQSFWKTFKVGERSKQQENFVTIWDKLFSIYNNFRAKLDKNDYAYEGMVYRKMAENAINNNLEINFKKVALVGFNALNNCEVELFNFLKRSKQALFYWDYDFYYLNNEKHQAALFIKRQLQNYKNEISEDNYYNFQKPKNLEILSIPSHIGEVKVAGKLLEKAEFKINKPLETAIVLGDEQLLIPLLYSIPEAIHNVNITMGYPLQNSIVFNLIESVENLQKNIKITSGKVHFYYKDALSVLSNPLLAVPGNEIEKLKSHFIEENLVFVKADILDKYDFTKFVFKPLSNSNNYLDYLLEIILTLYKTYTNENDLKQSKLNREILFQVYKHLNKLKLVLNEQDYILPEGILQKLLKKLLVKLKIPFIGEPLSGLQVMGLLESRNLDFENLIILSVNEGILPSTPLSSSFIPYNLRKAFSLPLNNHFDSIIAYHFYRLIQRAKNVYFLYNTKTDGINSGEMSRFLHQLLFEAEHKIEQKQVTTNIELPVIQKITIQKDENVLAKLLDKISNPSKYISPTAIISYLECKLKFYFKYITDLKEPDEIVEEIDQRIFGNIFHDVLYEIYKPFINRVVNNTDIEKIINNEVFIKQALLISFNKIVFRKSLERSLSEKDISGKNQLMFNVLKTYIVNVLKFDKRKTPFTVQGLEKKMTSEITVSISNTKYKINIGGTIDRIDLKDGALHIIDYKTGSNDKNKVKDIEHLFNEKQITNYKNIFQILIYSLLYDKNEISNQEIFPTLYHIQKMAKTEYSQFIGIGKSKKIAYSNINAEFENKLNTLFTELLDKNIPFSQTDDSDKCQYCPYKSICHKE